MTLQQQYDALMVQLNETYGKEQIQSMCEMAHSCADFCDKSECITIQIINNYGN